MPWVWRRVFTTSRGVVNAAARAPDKAPAVRKVGREKAPVGFKKRRKLSFDIIITDEYGTLMISVVGRERKRDAPPVATMRFVA
mmetsp:Transcript_37868/g.38232  ORF Transcript_37868/g.38232 Transcript_37868/m.38232 type:complete len:84 (-) Transcript_37868:663-914(-)